MMRESEVSGRCAPLRRRAVLALPALLCGCSAVVLDPAGDVAVQEKNLVLWSTGLMLLIIVPVIAFTLIFAWRYRASSKEAEYDPEFDHSTVLELVIWSAPLLIIICLGALTWGSTHLLDPYRPVDRLGPGQRFPAGAKPLEVDVVAMDWKWLFIYPELGIATVNQAAVPVNRPLDFHLTATSVMNSFFVPALAGQIYAMPGMETRLGAVMNKTGSYRGFAANYNGAGFSDMHFQMLSLPPAAFDQWVAAAKRSSLPLNGANFVKLESPSQDVRPFAFGDVDPAVFNRAVNRCVEPGHPCIAQVMMHDMGPGGGVPGNPRPGAGNTPVNDTGSAHGDVPAGALFKSDGAKGTSPTMVKPRGKAPGALKPGSMANRNFSLNTAPALPGARVHAQG